MKLRSVSGNVYWYDCKSNKVECYTGQEKESMPCVRYLDVPRYKNLPELEHFIIEITRDCNLRCSYCCYSGQYRRHRVHERRSMKEVMVDDVITFIDTVRNPNKPLTISLYGGEPLMKSDIVRYTINRCKKVYPLGTTYTISTNGLLLNEEMLLFCVDNAIILNVSLDGMPSLHDKNRRDKLGYPTFGIVHQHLESILYKYPDYWENNIRIFITIESLSQLKDISIFWGEDDILRRKAPTAVSTIAPNYDIMSNRVAKSFASEHEIIELLDYYEKNRDNLFCKGFLENFVSDALTRPIFDIPEYIYPIVCLPNNYRCFIDVNGNVGICEKVCDDLRFGNIYSGIDMNTVNNIVSDFSVVKKSRCESCWAFRLCKTCFTNYGYSESQWEEDCDNSKGSVKLQLLTMLELAERELLYAEEASQIQLRKLRPDDVYTIKRIMKKEKVISYMACLSSCQTTKGASLLYDTLTDGGLSKDEYAVMRGIVNEEHELIGIVGVDSIEDNKGNLFFFLDDEYWGKGIMTYAMSVFLSKHLRKGIRAYARISKKNYRALNLAKKFSSITIVTEEI